MRLAVVAALCLSMVGLAVAVESQAAMTKMPTNIPAQGLGPALKTLAKDRGFQVVFRSEVVGSARTQGATGNLTTLEALTQLLNGTELTYSYLDGNTITIVPRAELAPGSADDPHASPTGEVDPKQTSGKEEEKNRPFRVAQLDQNSAGPQAVSDDQISQQKKKDELTEIIVTGTNIRGLGNTTSPIIQFDRSAIDRSGYLNTADFIQSIPQMFGGGSQGASPDGAIGPGSNAGNNNEHATAANLRGLGENATLTLLDGHRMAPSAFGNVVDLSVIPLSAIDHIDVLTDGASAIYGADAVAGVVNIVLRKNYDGAETRLSYGGVTSGGLREQTLGQLFGRTWSTGSIMGSVEYSHEGTLSTEDRPFTATAPQPTNILNPSTELSLVTDGHQQIGDRVDISGDALVTWKRTYSIESYGAGNAYNVFDDPHQENLHLDLNYTPIEGWGIDLGETYSREETDIAFNSAPATSGDILGPYSNFYTSTMSSTDINVNGSLFSLPGGEVKLAFGGTYRREQARNRSDGIFDSTDHAIHRDVSAEFAEFYVPLFGSNNSLPALERLVVSAAVRRDDYSDFGSTTDPKFGLLWAPTSELTIRGNWSRSFRPPSMGELLSNAGIGSGPTLLNYPFANPSGPGTVPVFILGGVNPSLSPEKARNVNFGVDYKPIALQGLDLGINYYDVYFNNRIIRPPFDVNALLNPGVYGSIITPFSTQAAADAYLASFQAEGGQFIDILGTGAAGIRYLYNQLLQNAAVTLPRFHVHQNLGIFLMNGGTDGQKKRTYRTGGIRWSTRSSGRCDWPSRLVAAKQLNDWRFQTKHLGLDSPEPSGAFAGRRSCRDTARRAPTELEAENAGCGGVG